MNVPRTSRIREIPQLRNEEGTFFALPPVQRLVGCKADVGARCSGGERDEELGKHTARACACQEETR